MYNTLGAYERQFGAATFSVQSRAHVKGHGDLAVDDVFTGDSPMLGASTAVAGPLTMLLSNDVEPVTIDGLDITVTTTETPRSATIERVWLDEVSPRPGRTIPLKVLTRSYRGEEKDLDRADRDTGQRYRRSVHSRDRRPSIEHDGTA